MDKTLYHRLREQKLNNLSRRFSASLVTIALSCRTGASVRAAIENVHYFVEDYANFLDETLVAEDTNEPSRDGHGRRDGVCDRGCTGPDAISERVQKGRHLHILTLPRHNRDRNTALEADADLA